MKFSVELARSGYQLKQLHHLFEYFDHSLVSELKNDIGTNQHVPNRILCKAADLNDYLSKKKASAQIPKEQHSNFRLLCTKAWK